MDVDVDAQRIISKLGPQTSLVWFVFLLSALINMNQSYKLSSEESKSLNELHVARAQQDTVNKYKWKWDDCKAMLDCANMAVKLF